MKILHICLACLYIEGMSYQENIIPRKNREEGHTVFILAGTRTLSHNNVPVVAEPCKDKSVDNGIKLTRISPIYRPKLFRFFHVPNKFPNISNYLEEKRPDIVFIHGSEFGNANEIIQYKKNNPFTKVYLDSHQDMINSSFHGSKIKQKFIRFAFGIQARKISKICETVWGVTPGRCDYLTRIYRVDPSKVKLLLMGFDESYLKQISTSLFNREAARKMLGCDEETTLIVSGGKIDDKKAIVELCQAFADINVSNTKLVIFGEANNETEQRLKTYFHNDSIVFCGWKNSLEIAELFSIADLAVFPGTHSVLWEQAVAQCLPSIFRRFPMMNQDDIGGNCIYINDGTPKSIGAALSSILLNPSLLQSMKEAARKPAHLNFYYGTISKQAIGEIDK